MDAPPSGDITNGPLRDEVVQREMEIARLEEGKSSDEEVRVKKREELRAMLRHEYDADPARWTRVSEWADAKPDAGREGKEVRKAEPAAKPEAAAPAPVGVAGDDAVAEAKAEAEGEGEGEDSAPINETDKCSWSARDRAVRPQSNFGTSNEEGRAARGDHFFKHGDKIREPWEGGKDSLRILEMFLARGEFGDVSHVINTRRDNRDEVMKSVRILGRSDEERQSQQSGLVDEVRMMMLVGGHVNVLQVLGCMMWKNEFLTFLEYVGNGRELVDIITKRELAVAADATAAECATALRRVLTLALQLARGLAHIHSRFVLHNDVRRAGGRRRAGEWGREERDSSVLVLSHVFLFREGGRRRDRSQTTRETRARRRPCRGFWRRRL